MNIAPLFIIFVIGILLWWKSGVKPIEKYFLVGFAILFVVWWLIWGQLAVYDKWWLYNENNVLGFYFGVVPFKDILYFMAGLGWYLYFCRKLNLF